MGQADPRTTSLIFGMTGGGNVGPANCPGILLTGSEASVMVIYPCHVQKHMNMSMSTAYLHPVHS